ncbi:hypothetical protein MUY27_17770 [Mucilaginibacter sp. RS28]|uniref:Uncharacterized protein n=1 Tax=Mucilaginibacter straminoryzae TaxID=2932774 RepID=A0A9X1X8D2_9SPHI|nr:hypothetical protein [Mucilaginibacter straminoryzae]MCJ8211573.1 hypothetical protein [Mucilaginibacter straminoryzae]
MTKQSIIQTAREYVYDLGNTAKEFGFKNTESWQLSLVTSSERRTLERSHHPTITIALLPESITEFVAEVKASMIRANTMFTRVGNIDLQTMEKQFLVAYNTNRPR